MALARESVKRFSKKVGFFFEIKTNGPQTDDVVYDNARAKKQKKETTRERNRPHAELISVLANSPRGIN